MSPVVKPPGDFAGKATFDALKGELRAVLGGCGTTREKLLRICRLLEANVPHYHWVGFYLTDDEEEGMLVLGPYVGAPTEHTRIPFGKGICGRAASTGATLVVQDVSKEDDYLSCSASVRSEVVVPILDHDGKVLGELDIDSHLREPFGTDDREFLENVCRMVRVIL